MPTGKVRGCSIVLRLCDDEDVERDKGPINDASREAKNTML